MDVVNENEAHFLASLQQGSRLIHRTLNRMDYKHGFFPGQFISQLQLPSQQEPEYPSVSIRDENQAKVKQELKFRLMIIGSQPIFALYFIIITDKTL